MANRYLILSDIHANIYALQSVLDDAGPVDGCWCLGDVVGYGPHPGECLRLLRDEIQPTIWILGNHDAALVGDFPLQGWLPDAQVALEINRQLLAQAENRDIAAWATTFFTERCLRLPCGVVVAGQTYALVHGTLGQALHGYLNFLAQTNQVGEWTGESEFKRLWQLYHVYYPEPPYPPRRLLLGQTHRPTFLRAHEAEPAAGQPYSGAFTQVPIAFNAPPCELGPLPVIINPGSVGQPRDHDNRAAYAILDVAADTIEFRRVAYDYQRTQRDMRDLPSRVKRFPAELIERLAIGT
ncbi:MAG: metallophosphoesterase family protein [Chloroflexota bacterium]|nr:metallophosphoesterase family protein [Chloroflexota bacterium]